MGASHFSGPVYSENGFVGAITGNITGNVVGNLVDASGNEILVATGVASAVNEVTITSAATTAAPLIAASGETNVPLSISAKGTGTLTLWTGAGTREALILPNVASAINEVTITQAAIGVAPSITATGGDTNVGLRIGAKATAQVMLNGQSVFKTTVTTDATAGVLAYTAAMFLGGLILRDCGVAGRADTIPTAAALVAAMPGCAVGDSFRVTIRNTSSGADTITVSVATGGTISGTATIAQNNSKTFLVVLTNVTGSSEAYVAYSQGTLVT